MTAQAGYGSNPIFFSFAGVLDQTATQRIFQTFTIASQQRVSEIHLLFQSAGGNVSEGVALYNFIRNFPVETRIYNVGSVQSAAVIVFLGAPRRFASVHATFMIHRAYLAGIPAAHSGTLSGLANTLELDDERTLEILKNHVRLPDERWIMHQSMRDVSFGAKQALEYGVIHEIREFIPPPGSQIFNVLG